MDEYDYNESIELCEFEIQELKDQLALTEKALELACDKLAYKYCFQMGEDAFCGDCKPCLIDYFKEQAKEMMKSE